MTVFKNFKTLNVIFSRVKKAIAKKEETTQLLREQMIVRFL